MAATSPRTSGDDAGKLHLLRWGVESRKHPLQKRNTYTNIINGIPVLSGFIRLEMVD
jgi:hypothetical protein